ncbi:MAG TPA: OmpW family outer membrane protein [Gemmatimonadales bacterium]|nr:OmpW family outer membrane protein [Gemmatimonadales bacterium]
MLPRTPLHRWIGLALTVLVGGATTPPVAAQVRAADDQTWTFTTRVVATGSSDESQPPGYKVYSAFTIEAALRRSLGRLLAAEATVRTESREVDSLVPAGQDRRLGSLELLPMSVLLQLRVPTHGRVAPYVGAGVNLTVAWEKSGALDSVDMAGSVGPAVQAGADWAVSPRVLLNLDLRWNAFTADLNTGGARLASLKVDPLSLGFGVGFRF